MSVGGSLFSVYPLSNPDLSSPGTASTAEKPILLNNITDAEAFISGVEVAVIGFFQVCSLHLPCASCEPCPTLMGAWGWMWYKHLPKAAPVPKGAGADRRVEGLGDTPQGERGEFSLCV